MKNATRLSGREADEFDEVADRQRGVDLSVVKSPQEPEAQADGPGREDDAPAIDPSDARRRYKAIGVGLAATDAMCLSLALVAAWFVRNGFTLMDLDYVLVVLLAPLLWVAVFHGFGLYAPQHLHPAQEFRRTLGATSFGMLLVMVGSFWSESLFSRLWVAITWMFAMFLELLGRHAWRRYQGRLKADGRLAFRTLIVGTNEEAGRLALALKAPTSGFEPIGFIAASGPSISPDGLSVLGRIETLGHSIREHGADCVFVASTAIDADGVLSVAQAARQEGVEVRVSANLPEILTSRLTVQQVGSAMALTVKPVQLSGTQNLLKRAFDLGIASMGVIGTLPLWILIALGIRLTSRGPVFFRQQRITKGGRPFNVFKFRTMVEDAGSYHLEQAPDPTAPFFKPQNDPRLTKIGSILRKASLDELPQLLNVVRGEMSLVGPRPLPAEQVAANLEMLRPRHEVPAGVTGWWQINGRSDLNPEQALRLDLFYIENWSLTLDLYILLKTVGVLLARRGAY